LNPSSGTLYALLYFNGTTLALDAQSLKTIAKISTPSPYAVAVDASTNTVYVSQGEGASITVIDGASNSVVTTVQGAGTPYALAIDEPQDLVFAADPGGGALWVVQGSTDRVVGHVKIEGASAVAFDPTTDQAFIGNLSSNGETSVIEVLDTSNMSVTRSIPFPAAIRHLDADPASHLLFATSGSLGPSGANFVALNETTYTIAYSIELGNAPDLIAVSASSPCVYVSDVGSNRLYELEGTTGRVVSNATGAPGVSFTGITGMTFDAGTGRLYITESDSTALIVLATGPTPTTTPQNNASLAVLLAVPAIASVAVGSVAIVVLRRRGGRSRSRPED
jgi:DNA-binding beta-propeller fold protein YncE